MADWGGAGVAPILPSYTGNNDEVPKTNLPVRRIIMDPVFILLALVTVVSAVAAMSLPNLVHCALSLMVTFAGLAALFLHLNAQFVGFAQVLVYIGAVAILIVFAILLTRGGEEPRERSTSPYWGVLIAVLAFGCLSWAVVRSAVSHRGTPSAVPVPVADIGTRLMKDYVLPLEIVGLLLTAALLGAVIVALRETNPTKAATEPQADNLRANTGTSQ
jgi:NADH:ubiquinone oxidoreductase subunit 6 (subunit J)